MGPSGSLTYGELDKRSNRLANFLLSRGAKPSDRLAVLGDDTASNVCAVLGALKAGCAFVPLDPGLPKARLQQMLSLSEPRWLYVRAVAPVACGGNRRRGPPAASR